MEADSKMNTFEINTGRVKVCGCVGIPPGGFNRFRKTRLDFLLFPSPERRSSSKMESTNSVSLGEHILSIDR